MPKNAKSHQEKRKELRARLRDRFRRLGLHNFKDAEALGILLTYSIKRGNVKPLVKELIARYRDFMGVLDAHVDELMGFPGMDESSATLIKLARESVDYYLKERVFSVKDAIGYLEQIRYLRAAMRGLKDEQFRVVYKDAQMNVIAIETIAVGTVNSTIVHPRKVMERALYHNAVTLMFAHNHPGGKPMPSLADKELTMRLVEAARLLDMDVCDHIIIGRDDFFSFRNAGLLH